MKIRKTILGLSIAFVFLFMSGCDMDFTNGNNHSNQFDVPITNRDSIQITETTTHYEMVNQYQEACATVIVYNSKTTQEISSGSGVAVYAGGYIATNWHVISDSLSKQNSTAIKVQLYENKKFVEYNAKLLWSNVNFDLAIVRCEFPDIPYVKMADRWINSDNQLKISEDIWTLGSPTSKELQGTYTKGNIASNIQRHSSSSYRIYESLIQHTAPISNGSSGSGLFDWDGNLVGLNTLGMNSSSTIAVNNIFFAVPIYPLINIISQIATLEEDDNLNTNYVFPTIGVSGYDNLMAEYYKELLSNNSTIEYKKFSGNGVYAEKITVEGPCYEKLLKGDIIVGISTTTSNQNSLTGYYKVEKRNDLLFALSNFKPGDKIKVYYTRKVSNNVIEITLN